MSGSVSNNLNNRADEVFGIAEDARQAEEHGILPPNLRRAYIYLLEVTQNVMGQPVRQVRTVGDPDPIFRNASYLDRVAIMCERMRESGLYHLVWVIGVTRDPLGYVEPSPAVGWDRFSSALREGFKHGEATPAPQK